MNIPPPHTLSGRVTSAQSFLHPVTMISLREKCISWSPSNVRLGINAVQQEHPKAVRNSSELRALYLTIAPDKSMESRDAGSAIHVPVLVPSMLRFLLVCDAFNTMAQRALLKLEQDGHQVIVHVFQNSRAMVEDVERHMPDVILCPFLTKRIPKGIYEGEVPCLVIHPGIEGDRGMSSIDWALQESEQEWGVTILQAEEEMDAGPIWATRNFTINRQLGGPPSKSSLYRIECVDAAMKCLDDVLQNLRYKVAPRPLNYTNPDVRGRLRSRMTQADRYLDWNLHAAELARIIRASDSQPGTLSMIGNDKYLLFGAHVEQNPPTTLLGSAPRYLLGHRDGAILVRCGHGTALWISHLKKSVKSIKLPSMLALPANVASSLRQIDAPGLQLPMQTWPTTYQEIFYWTHQGVTYLWFDFYNGAMNTDQCNRLAQALDEIDRVCDTRVLVLMGGINYFSNGIHLNTIEAANDPANESWQNINAIDDVVYRILTCSKRVTVTAMLGNAGAGGAMAAIASDFVWAHGNVVLNPSYKAMELYGSEYWTYSLPKRVESEIAENLITTTTPVSAARAKQIGLIDDVLCPSSDQFVKKVIKRAEELSQDPRSMIKIAEKEKGLADLRVRLAQHRHEELIKMRACFQTEIYNRKRREFVTKSSGNLPCQLELKTHQNVQSDRNLQPIIHF